MKREWREQLLKLFVEAIAETDQRVLPVAGKGPEIGSSYRDQIQTVLNSTRHAHEKWERECLELMSTAKSIVDGAAEVKAELEEGVLKCEMGTGELHTASFRRVGPTIFFEASFDNGCSAYCESVGVLLGPGSSREVVSFAVTASADGMGVQSEPYTGGIRRDIMMKKIEWFVTEVGRRVPLYRSQGGRSKPAEEKECR